MLRVMVTVILTCLSSAAFSWEYDTSKDEMREIEIKTARVSSNNSIAHRSFDTSFLYIVLRDWPGEGRSAMLRIAPGAFDCYRGCKLVAKFDDGELITYSAVRGGSGNSDWLFINERQGFERRTKEASRLTLEVPLYRAGAQQFSFDIEGLEWP